MAAVILTPDQRLRVFVSSTLQELADERKAAKAAIAELKMSPVMFELGARPHPPRELYRSYLAQSHIFVGIYWQRYGWVAPGEEISGLEDEYRLSGDRPKLMYVKTPAPEREDRLKTLLRQIQSDDQASYKPFTTARELRRLLENDLAVLLTERFTASLAPAPGDLPRPGPAPRTGLPLALTAFIGREAEVQAVSDLLRQAEVRLVTLVGPGGIGKSRLALEVARRLQGEYDGGVVFVPLAQLVDPTLVEPAIAAALGAPDEGGGPFPERLARHLGDRRTLLLLDNFEQLSDAAPLLSDLLASAPGLTMLVTSRAALQLSAEHVFEVPPLRLPTGGRSPLEAIRTTEAVELFVARARAVRPGFTLTVDNALAVAELCYRLDGLPLAIELAAARVTFLPPQALLRRLDRRFEVLTGGARDLPSRQQTLRNTIDWSYDLLSEADGRLFARLGVFVGGCTFEAAEAIGADGGPDGGLDVLDSLASLVSKSLVRQHDHGGEARFTMLESIAEYAREKLDGSGEADAVRERHFGYYLQLAETGKKALAGPDQPAALAVLATEHDNLRAALAWALAKRDHERVADLAGALGRFWIIHGHIAEGRGWLGRALEAGGEVPDGVRIRVQSAAAVLADEDGDLDAALRLHQETLTLAKRLGHRQAVAASIANIATQAYRRGDLDAAEAQTEESLALYREVGDAWGESATLSNLGMFAEERGDYALARRYAEQALGLLRELGDPHAIATPLFNLGRINTREGRLSEAWALFGETLGIYRAADDRRNVASTLEALAGVCLARHEPEQAARLLAAADALRTAAGLPPIPSEVVEAEATLEAVRKQLDAETFAAAWAEGATTDLDRVAALTAVD